MKLNIDQIRAVCQGAVRIEETEKGVRLHRFTGEQEELYRQKKPVHWDKVLATAGMKLCFETDSNSLFLRVNAIPGSSRAYFSVDVMVNGACVGHLDNFAEGSASSLRWRRRESRFRRTTSRWLTEQMTGAA